MSLGTTYAATLVGVQGSVVEVQADVAPGLPGFALVGLPDTALSESKERVRAAIARCGQALPQRRITVNLSPASLPKSGSGFDLAIAVSVLAAMQVVPAQSAQQALFLGELGLDGTLRPVRGVLPSILAARDSGLRRCFVAEANATEARLVPDIQVLAVRSLAHASDVLQGNDAPCDSTIPSDAQTPAAQGEGTRPDLREIAGAPQARFALEVAAAGGHHLLMVGPPGTGKTMLAERFVDLLPNLTTEQALEVTAVHSVAGSLDTAAGLIRRPPLQRPHHTTTVTAMVGGGSGIPRPGAVSQAHHGVLLLDEAAEFSATVLDALRQPLESGSLMIHRAQAAAQFPARFQLILTANPCPCGKSLGKGRDCTCTPQARRRYFARLSGPILDRVDLRIPVFPPSRTELWDAHNEDTATVAQRVHQARQRQAERLAGTSWTLNAQVPGQWLRERAGFTPRELRAVHQVLESGALSARGYDRILRVAWSIADVLGHDRPGAESLEQALELRHAAHGASL